MFGVGAPSRARALILAVAVLGRNVELSAENLATGPEPHLLEGQLMFVGCYFLPRTFVSH
jgi:hypothetical protein